MIYESRTTKRPRRTKKDMDSLADKIAEALAEDAPMTVRQVFYRLVTLSAIDKTEQQYKAVMRLLVKMRQTQRIGWDTIADNSREPLQPLTFSSIGEALRHTALTYCRSRWDTQRDYVEIWLEKDALANVLYSVTAPYDVALMVVHGFSSHTFLHSAAETIAKQSKPVFLYYIGDNDPSGLDVCRCVEKEIRAYAPDADITFTRIAVTEKQIKSMKLPTRETKKSDPRSKSWTGDSVEVDAIPPKVLRDLVEKCIVKHITDRRAWDHMGLVERSDKEWLRNYAAKQE